MSEEKKWFQNGNYWEYRTDGGMNFGQWRGCLFCIDRYSDGSWYVRYVYRDIPTPDVPLRTKDLEVAKALAVLLI